MQSLLNLPLSHRTVLVSMEVVRAVQALDWESIMAKVDCGEFRFAFDISAAARGSGHCAEWRFWVREIIAPESCAGLEMPRGIEMIINTTRPRLSRIETAHILGCTRTHVMRLVDSGFLIADAAAADRFITRASLQDFLKTKI